MEQVSLDAPFIPSECGTVERAFELARSGEYENVEMVARRLSKEGHSQVEAHLSGYSSLRREIHAICQEQARQETESECVNV